MSSADFRFFFLPVLLLICSVSLAQHPGWTEYTNCNQVNILAVSGNDIWIGTKDGLVKVDKTSGIMTFYSTFNSGLPGNCYHVNSN